MVSPARPPSPTAVPLLCSTVLLLSLAPQAPAAPADASASAHSGHPNRLVQVASAAEISTVRADYLVERIPARATAYASADGRELFLDNGLVRRTLRLAPDGATVAIDDLSTGETVLRAARPAARVNIDGRDIPVGGLVGQPNHAFLKPAWLDALEPDPDALHLVGYEVGEATERLEWKRVRHAAPDARWPAPGVHLRLDFEPDRDSDLPPVAVRVHHELFDGVPVMSKWIEVENRGDAAFSLESYAAEILAVVEEASWVETREGVRYPTPSKLSVETDYSFGGMTPANASRHTVHWLPDPQYTSQVNYRRETPCLLEVSPALGPGMTLAPGEVFTSFRVFELVHDSTDRERRGLALRRMYRTVAPWVTENPLMHHLRVSDPAEVRRAIDQAAEVGFEMVILSFGSGFDIESEDEDYLRGWATLAEHAASRGIELGGYSLLASRSISPEDDVVLPEGRQATFGHSPCLGSSWGQAYFAKLYRFFETTGFSMLEHDGNYPGDECYSSRHPGHARHADSRWRQWRVISDFYRWCRARGIYLNVPDYYYLTGSTKNGMGYREVNWSLPRAQQVLHTRQNIYDGTWTKTPSMGWMFVPLTEYQGGGAAATVEPLDEHLDHYRRMLQCNLALGVQACYRGPRLFDTARTREMLAGEVRWYKEHREILESDLVHGRRADGRDVDWMLHVDPFPSTPGGAQGMLVAFNPLEEDVIRELRVDVTYTGLEGSLELRGPGRSASEGSRVPIGSRGEVEVRVEIPAGGMTWATMHP